jgi:hypothetical protein
MQASTKTCQFLQSCKKLMQLNTSIYTTYLTCIRHHAASDHPMQTFGCADHQHDAVQEKEDPTEEEIDAELAAAKQAAAAMSKSGRLLARSFGFRSKKALQPTVDDDEDAEDAKAGPATP